MKHIGIIGSFGSGNIGDEAAWMAVQRFLESKEPQWKYHTHIFHWASPYQTCGHKSHPIYLLTNNEMAWINENFKAMIIVGGGIVGWKWGLTKTPRLDTILKELKIPIYTISISAEKGVYSPSTKVNVETLMEVSKVFTVRDTYSQDNIEELTGIKPDITPDVVSILGEKYPIDKKKVEELKDVLMVNASNCLTDEMLAWWKSLFKELNVDDNISCIPFVPSRNDILMSTMSSSSNLFNFYQPEEIVSIMMQKNFVIAGRLHAAVFAATAKTPFFAINYHPKVKAFCDSIGYPHYYPKTNDYPTDITEYGFDLSKINKEELISEIKKVMANPVEPPNYHTAMDFLEEIYNKIESGDTEKVPCMYCGEDIEINKTDKFVFCQNCKNTNHTNNV